MQASWPLLKQGRWVSQAYRAADGSSDRLALYLSGVPCGFPSPADDFIEQELNLHDHIVQHPAATFLLTAVGESMTASGIMPGAILVVDRAVDHQPGRVVVAVVEGEFTVKRLRLIDGCCWLVADDDRFGRILVDDSVQLWGTVIWVAHQP